MTEQTPDTATLRAFKQNLIDEFRASEGKVTGQVHNLRANPRAHIEVGTDAFDVTARELPSAERAELFPKVTAAAPGFADYQAKTSRVIPLFELHRA
jgi:deazaflavin-dependent oxidoreductase (nitroreductase family)